MITNRFYYSLITEGADSEKVTGCAQEVKYQNFSETQPLVVYIPIINMAEITENILKMCDILLEGGFLLKYIGEEYRQPNGNRQNFHVFEIYENNGCNALFCYSMLRYLYRIDHNILAKHILGLYSEGLKAIDAMVYAHNSIFKHDSYTPLAPSFNHKNEFSGFYYTPLEEINRKSSRVSASLVIGINEAKIETKPIYDYIIMFEYKKASECINEGLKDYREKKLKQKENKDMAYQKLIKNLTI